MILVFEDFRKMGVGRKLFEFLEEEIRQNKEKEQVEYIGLFVQETNTAAIKFYEKMDFETVKMVKGYYNNIKNPDARLMRKMI